MCLPTHALFSMESTEPACIGQSRIKPPARTSPQQSMKLSTVFLTLTWTALTLHAGFAGGTPHKAARARAESSDQSIPLQLNQQADLHEWKAPVVDQTSPRQGAGWTTEQQKPVFVAEATHQEPHENDRAKGSATERLSSALKDSTKLTKNGKAGTTQRDVHISPAQKTSAKSSKHHERAHSKATDRSEFTPAEQKSKSSGTASSKAHKPLHPVKPKQGQAVDEDLYAAALGGMLTNQYYNDAQIEEEARTLGAAVVTRLTDSFREETSKSLAFSGGIAGLAVGVLGIVAVVVALFRQHTVFAEVEFESDLADLELGPSTSAPTSSADRESLAESGVPEEQKVDALGPSIPSFDLEEHEVAKDEDEDEEEAPAQ